MKISNFTGRHSEIFKDICRLVLGNTNFSKIEFRNYNDFHKNPLMLLFIRILFLFTGFISFTYYIEYQRLYLTVPYPIWGLNIMVLLVCLWNFLLLMYGVDTPCIL